MKRVRHSATATADTSTTRASRRVRLAAADVTARQQARTRPASGRGCKATEGVTAACTSEGAQARRSSLRVRGSTSHARDDTTPPAQSLRNAGRNANLRIA